MEREQDSSQTSHPPAPREGGEIKKSIFPIYQSKPLFRTLIPERNSLEMRQLVYSFEYNDGYNGSKSMYSDGYNGNV